MKTLFNVVMLATFTLLTGHVHAEGSAYNSFDWGAMTTTTTGSVSFERQLVDRMSTLNTYCCTQTEHGDGLSYTQAGQSAVLSNTLDAFSANLWNDGATGLASIMFQTSIVTLSGAGSVTFNIPYEHSWTNTGGYVPYMNMGINIYGLETMYRGLESWHTGAGSSTGNFTFTLSNSGGSRDFELHTYMLTNVGVIPEPETYAMLASGLIAVALARRRQSRRTTSGGAS